MVRRQVRRNRAIPAAVPDSGLPVYGTAATRFNDAGVDRFYLDLLALLEARGPRRWPSRLADPGAAAFSCDRHLPIIPFQRTHYLQEIVAAVRGYRQRTEVLAAQADRLQALETVCRPARMARRPVAQAEAKGRELLARVGLSDRVEHKPYELSGGEQQRVAIARALINDPALILADEPTGNLDSHTGQEIMNLLCSLRDEKGTTLVMATHDPQVAARAPKTIELVDGQIPG